LGPPSNEVAAIPSWPSIQRLAARAPLAEGYRLDLLKREEIDELIAFIGTWFPDISVGSASGYLRPAFYGEQVCFADNPGRDVLVLVLKHGDELAGVFSCERDRDTLSLYAGIGVAAPRHRGAGLALAGLRFTEAIGRRMGMGLVYGMATLKAPYVQRAFERAGWQLIGITPGYDREMIEPGVVKRVYEAVYAKVLVTEAGLLMPHRRNLTPRTQAFFDWVFATQGLDPQQTRAA